MLVSSHGQPGDIARIGGWRLQRLDVGGAPMGRCWVLKTLELAQGTRQVPLVPKQGPVQQIVAGLDPQLHHRVHSRHLDAGEHDLNACARSYRVEQPWGTSLSPVSRIRTRARHPVSSRSMTRFLATWSPRRASDTRSRRDADPACAVLDHRLAGAAPATKRVGPCHRLGAYGGVRRVRRLGFERSEPLKVRVRRGLAAR
jgi:hypothetical protein